MNPNDVADETKLPVQLREYNDTTDKPCIIEMCRNVYGGTDETPKAVSLFAKSKVCKPYVLTAGKKVVGFCNVRILHTEEGEGHAVLLESVRVSEGTRGCGYGTILIEEVMGAVKAFCDSPRAIRFLATTVPDNSAMRRIFEKTPWACRGISQIWPDFYPLLELRKAGVDATGRLLDILEVSQYIPQHAKDAVPEWERLYNPEEILVTMKRLQEHGSSFLRAAFYNLDTPEQASRFLECQVGEAEGRSVWKLERPNKPPVLLFVQRRCLDYSEPQPDDTLSACVADIEGAECCVAFAGADKELQFFKIGFDSAISREMMNNSPLLSKVKSDAFMVFEATL